MLNLTHHMMVQYCASLVSKVPFGTWYQEYVVLGDDIVIFDQQIADLYLTLCKGLGVEINLSKSVLSPNKPVFEFAKRTIYFGKDVSAISFKDIIQSNSFFGRLATVSRLIKREYGKDMRLLFQLGNRVPRTTYTDLKYPIIGYMSQLLQQNSKKFNLDSLLSLITNSDYPISFFGRKIH